MNVLIIEDESLAAEKLELMLLEIDSDIKIVAKLKSIKESVKWLLQHTADLIFLDIQISDGLSFSIFEQVSVATPVIFTTAYDQYAIQAFRLNSVAYLLKPIRHADLKESLTKYKNLKTAYSIDFDSLIAQAQGKKQEFKKRFLVQIGLKIRKVDVDEIAYFHVLDKDCYLRTFKGNDYALDYTLDKLQTLLDPNRFFRINRKYIISMESIANMIAYSRSRVKLELTPKADVETDTIVSIDRSSDFKKWIDS